MTEVYDINAVESWDDKPKEAQKVVKYWKKHGRVEYSEDIKHIESYVLDAIGFRSSTVLERYPDWTKALICEDSGKYCLIGGITGKFKLRELKEIETVELIDGVTGNSALGGAILFGAAGAVVGASRKKVMMGVRLHTKDKDDPIVDIFTTSHEIVKTDKIFPTVQDRTRKIYGYFKAVAEKNNPANETPKEDTLDTVEKIRQFKMLLDEGILTQEEFEAKKKQLLGI